MLASGNDASVTGGSGTAWEAGADSSMGGATSSATVVEGSSPSQDRSVDFLQKHTQMVVNQPRLLQQVLLGKMQYLQA
jgi:L-lactate utilization protein LutC